MSVVIHQYSSNLFYNYVSALQTRSRLKCMDFQDFQEGICTVFVLRYLI